MGATGLPYLGLLPLCCIATIRPSAANCGRESRTGLNVPVVADDELRLSSITEVSGRLQCPNHPGFSKVGWRRPISGARRKGASSPVLRFGCSVGGREYRVSDAQARQLAAGIGRAYVAMLILLLILLVLAGTLVQIIMPGLFVDHPIAAFLALATFTMLMIGLFNAMVYRAAGSVLAGVSSTSAPREPYNPVSHFKKTAVLMTTFMTTFPTWLLVIVVILGLMAVISTVINAYKVLASGQVTFDVLIAALILWVWVESGAALVIKLRARRSAN